MVGVPFAEQAGGFVTWINSFVNGSIVVTQENVMAAFCIGGCLIILGISTWGALREWRAGRAMPAKRYYT